MNGDTQNNMFQPGMNAPERKSSMIGTVIVILIIVIGAIYLLASRSDAPTTTGTTSETTPTNDETMNQPDELMSVEAELNATTFSETDDSINQLDGELTQ